MYQLSMIRREMVRESGLLILHEELLSQCAYYPRPCAFGCESPCQRCSFNNTNKKCKRVHILVDTRIGKEWASSPNSPSQSLRPGGRRGEIGAKMARNEAVAQELGFSSWFELTQELKRWRGERV